MAKKKNDDVFNFLAKATKAEILSNTSPVKYFIDTGNLAFNWTCSGKFMGGGIPGGRITEFYGAEGSGKTYWGCNVVRGCQAIGGIPVYLDCENSLNNEWIVKTSHIDLDKVLVFDPSTGVDSLEGCFDKIYSTIRNLREQDPETPLVFVYDSLSASPSSDELAETQKDWNPDKKDQPGVRARICSKEFRKLNTLMEKTNSTLLVLNQTRLKIGVMYGCFSYDSKVVLADGSTMKIGTIVNQKIPVNVVSYNTETKEFEIKKVIGWHKNGNLLDDECFLQFVVKKPWGNGRSYFACTPNHRIFNANREELCAGELQIGDKVLMAKPLRFLNNDQHQLVYGSILGDGSFREHKNGSLQFRLCHGIKQKEYCQWKQTIMEPWVSYIDDDNLKRYGFDTIPMHELSSLKFNYNGACFIPDEVIKNIDELGLAIWYMDDGTYGGSYNKWGKGKSTIYCTKFKDRENLLSVFRRFGIEVRLDDRGFVFDAANTYKFHEIISKYVPQAMNYKIHPNFRKDFNYEITNNEENNSYIEGAYEVIDIYEKPVFKNKVKYDLTIEGNHTYLVDHVVVHNSPIISAGGGESLKFYASLRVCTAVQKKIENKKLGTAMGINLKVRNVKNRCTAPFLDAEGVQLFWKDGANPLSGLLTALIQSGRIEKSGSGSYTVKEPWAAGQEIKFRASKVRNDVDAETLYKCPALVDAKDDQELRDYLAIFGSAINQSANEENEEIDTKDGMGEDYE